MILKDCKIYGGVYMSLEKKYAVEFIGFFILIAAIIGVGFLSFDLLSHVYNSVVCNLFFLVVSAVLSLIYFYIVHRLDSKIL